MSSVFDLLVIAGHHGKGSSELQVDPSEYRDKQEADTFVPGLRLKKLDNHTRYDVVYHECLNEQVARALLGAVTSGPAADTR